MYVCTRARPRVCVNFRNPFYPVVTDHLYPPRHQLYHLEVVISVNADFSGNITAVDNSIHIR